MLEAKEILQRFSKSIYDLLTKATALNVIKIIKFYLPEIVIMIEGEYL